MELEGSLPHSQEPAASLCPEPEQSSKIFRSFELITCIDQMPTYLVLKKVHSMPVSEFSKDSL
jgi:hypothetical protein